MLTLEQVGVLIELLQAVEWDVKDFFARAKRFETACTK